jgi:hypothetical protein
MKLFELFIDTQSQKSVSFIIGAFNRELCVIFIHLSVNLNTLHIYPFLKLEMLRGGPLVNWMSLQR